QVRPPSAGVMQALSNQQRSRLTNGSVEERRATLAAFDPEKRRLVLAGAFPQMLEGMPDDIQKEAADARKAEQEDLQKERRRLMPPLNELLTGDQMRIANRGTAEEKLALLNSFDGEKRKQVLRMMPLQSFADMPDLRREAMALSQPQQLVNSELM